MTAQNPFSLLDDRFLLLLADCGLEQSSKQAGGDDDDDDHDLLHTRKCRWSAPRPCDHHGRAISLQAGRDSGRPSAIKPVLGLAGAGQPKKNLLFSPRPFLYRSKQNLTRVGHWAAEGKGHVHRQMFLSSIASSRLTPEQRRLCSCWFCVLSLWFQHFHAAWRMNHKLETQISWVIQAARAGFQSIHLSIHPCIFFLSFAGLSSPANLPHPVGFCCPPPPPS